MGGKGRKKIVAVAEVRVPQSRPEDSGRVLKNGGEETAEERWLHDIWRREGV